MKRIHYTVNATPEALLTLVADNRRVNDGIRFPEGTGAPTAEIRSRGAFVRIRCRMVGGASRDNGYLFGTAFLGTLRATEQGSVLSGLIVTEPLLHLAWLAITIYYVIACISVGGINLVPIFLSLFMYLFFRPEYQKQEVLFRYLLRAAKRLESR